MAPTTITVAPWPVETANSEDVTQAHSAAHIVINMQNQRGQRDPTRLPEREAGTTAGVKSPLQ